MIDISIMSEQNRIEFMIFIAKRAMSYLETDHFYDLLKKSIEACEGWYETKKHTGDYFYEILDNEENGLAMLQDEQEEDDIIELWNCIINTVAFIARKAYECEGTKYYPEPILMVSDALIAQSMSCLVEFSKEEQQHLEEKYRLLLER